VAYDVDSIENRDPELIQRLGALLRPVFARYFRPQVRGLENIPAGAALYVGNHNGGLFPADSFIFSLAVLDRLGMDAVPYGLAHDQAMRTPGLQHILAPLGAVRASEANGHKLFQAGRKVLVYPGGDLDSLRPYRARNRIVFGGRLGYMRLAIREGVPIVPVVSAGAHATFVVLSDGRWLAETLKLDDLMRLKAWPITLALPWGVMVGTLPYLPLPTPILIEALPPLHLERTGPEAAADEAYVAAQDAALRARMQDALTRLAEERGSRLARVQARVARWLGA
jgi:1-acyl-sn-glycerol-3-phosphate acyltransferase